MTLGIMNLSLAALTIMTLRITTINIITLVIMPSSIITLSVTALSKAVRMFHWVFQLSMNLPMLSAIMLVPYSVHVQSKVSLDRVSLYWE